MLLRNQLSLQSQTSRDWEQTILVDEQRRGVEWANGNLATVEATGDYIWFLDDDNECLFNDFVRRLKAEAEANQNPELIIVRIDHGHLGILPNDLRWEQRPLEGMFDGGCLVIRRDIWNRYRHLWQAEYCADFLFADALWDKLTSIHWWDVIAMRMQTGNNMRGAAE